MFINKVSYCMTTSLSMHFGTAEIVKDMKAHTIMSSLMTVIHEFQGR